MWGGLATISVNCTIYDVHVSYLLPLWMGSANSSMRADALAFLAASLTVKTSGLNCTWSIVSLTMGLLSSSSLKKLALNNKYYENQINN